MPVVIPPIHTIAEAWRALDELAREFNKLEKLLLELQARIVTLEGP